MNYLHSQLFLQLGFKLDSGRDFASKLLCADPADSEQKRAGDAMKGKKEASQLGPALSREVAPSCLPEGGYFIWDSWMKEKPLTCLFPIQGSSKQERERKLHSLCHLRRNRTRIETHWLNGRKRKAEIAMVSPDFQSPPFQLELPSSSRIPLISLRC